MVMARQSPYVLVYDPEIRGDLAAIESKYHGLIQATIDEQLRFEPETATRNRKPLKKSIGLDARWELRLGPDNRFRVFYRVDPDKHQVRILAIGVKVRDNLFLAGEKVDL
jgi:mRNA-degrading endonuclease RelE of RelBE toxin-antitoxin system